MNTSFAAVALAPAFLMQQMVDETFDFQAGDVVSFHSKGGSFPDQTYVVASCRDRGSRYEYSCDMRRIAPTVRNEPFWMTMNTWANLTYNDVKLIGRGHALPGTVSPATITPRVAGADRVATGPAQAAVAGGQCTGRVANAQRAASFSAAVAKWAIYDNYARRAREPGMTAPSAVGVTFESVAIGAPEANAVLTDPGRGARLRNDAAPRGAMLYPVKSTYQVCDQYNSGVQIRRMETRHVCFKSATGDWGCGVDGLPKTEWLAR